MTCNSCRSSAKRSLMIIINACAHVRSLRSHIRIYINRFPHCNPSCDLPVTQIHMPRPPRASKDLYISLLSKGGARINKTLIELHPFKSKFHFTKNVSIMPFFHQICRPGSTRFDWQGFAFPPQLAPCLTVCLKPVTCLS